MVKTRQNGKYVVIENEQDKEDMLDLYCVCGHTLREHTFHNTYGSTRTFETGGCSHSHCSQFKMTGRIETAGYAYAR